ncbi:MAG: acyl-CoA dehydrogenase family protein [Halobacteriovoraceae bacterium]|nr:acyl-CoA dehydrogenase family protein [Halobacteriovoraceae bacterium]
MDFKLSTEQNEIKELTRKFAQAEMIPLAAEYDEKGIFPSQVMQKAWELGLINTCIPAEFGGTGFSALDSVLITENLSYGCLGMNTSFMANDLALLPIVIAGSDEQKKKYLTPFTEEFKIASFCLTEPGYGSDAAGIKTQFKDQGDHWIVNGEKMWITNAGHANLFVVYGTVDPELRHKGLSALIVEASSEGIHLGKKEDKMGHRSSDTRGVRFENVKVPKENMLGAPGDGWKIAMKTLDHSRPLVASSAVGGMQRCLELSLQYSKERKQFNVALAKHQAIQFMIANMGMKTEAARLLVYKAACQLDSGEQNTMTASYAKGFAADSFMEVATDAVQVYGGYGYSKEYPVEKLMRDAKLIQIYEGTSQIQRLVMARELLK